MGPLQCGVCKEAQSKYKCPSCLVPYCSLGCFKNHKESICKESSPAIRETKTVVLPGMFLPRRLYGPDEANWVLCKDELVSVVKSDEIRKAFADGEFKNLILQIIESQDPEDELGKAEKGHAFHQFTEKIRDLFSPQDL